MKLVRMLSIRGWTLALSLVMLSGSIACGPGGPPEPPADVKTDINVNIDGQVVLTWTLKGDLKDRVAKFRVYRDDRQDGNFKSQVKELNQSDGKFDEDKNIYTYTFKDINVIVGGKYEVPFYYRVTAVDKENREGKPSGVLEAMTKNVNEPDYVANITAAGGNNFNDIKGKAEPRIIITWDANKEHDIDGYYVFRSDKDEPIKANDPSLAHNKEMIAHKPGAKLSWADKLKDEEIGKPYWYTVVAVDKGNDMGRRRASERFRGLALKTPNLVSPANGTTAAKPVFKWEEVDSAAAYVVVLQKDARGGEVWRSPVIAKGTTEVTLPNSVSLTTGLTYYWFVAAYAENPKSNKADGNSTSKLWTFDAASDD